MSNLTEDLHRYKELASAGDRFHEKWDAYRSWKMSQLIDALLNETPPEEHAQRTDALAENAPQENALQDAAYAEDARLDGLRSTELCDIEERIANAAVESPSVVIEDRELHQLFHEIRKSWIKNNILTFNGSTVTYDLFDKLGDVYRPKYFVERLVQARPLVTLIEIPQDVIDLLVEARTAYCLSLPTACISVCRSTIERAVVDIAVRIGRLRESDVQEGLRMCEKISSLIARDLTPQSPLRRELDEFLADTSRVIHSNTKGDEPLALTLYLKALELIKMLYGYYAKQLKN